MSEKQINKERSESEIEIFLKLKKNGELKSLYRAYHDFKGRVDALLRRAEELEDELCRDPEDNADVDVSLEEVSVPVLDESIIEKAVVSQEVKLEKKEKPIKADKPLESVKAEAPTEEKKEVKQEKKEEPKIRRINLEEINNKYNNDRRPRQGTPSYNNNFNNGTRPQTVAPMRSSPYQGTASTNPRAILGNKNTAAVSIVLKPEGNRKVQNKQKDNKPVGEGKKTMNKRTLIRKGYIEDYIGEERMGSRKLLNKKKQDNAQFVAPKIEKAIITTDNLTVKILSEKIGKPATDIIKQLMILGIMANINSVVDFTTMGLVASELGVEIELKLDKTKEEELADIHDIGTDESENLEKRPPIVTVMGHVDHGKTSLLDAIKHTKMALDEAGSITQHIGAYTIDVNGNKITFIDTPGHEAFTAMRARGANVTDIIILVVAVDDGVMPQTIEAINHAKAAEVPIIVAINKIDKHGTTTDRIKQQLTEYGILPEEWGGDSMMIPVSAKTGEGIDKLLEGVLLQSEVLDLKANPNRKAMCTIIEARLDKGKGPVASVIVNNGTLRVGDFVVSGTNFGKVRAMLDDKGKNVKESKPSYAVEILGLSETPSAGEIIYVVDDEKLAKQVAMERSAKIKNEQLEVSQKVSLDDMFSRISEGMLKNLNLIVKADVQGSVEALKASLLKLSNEEVRIRTIHGGVGAINKSDVMLAEASGAIIIGFNTKTDSSETKTLAENANIDIRQYSIIYDAISDIEAAVNGMVTPTFHEENMGKVEVRAVFKITGSGTIAGSYVLSGKVVRNCKARVLRGEEIVFEGNIESLKRFKDDVKEVAAGYECGISLQGFNEVKEGDIIEVYILERDKK